MMTESNLFTCSKHTFRTPNLYLTLLGTPWITVANDIVFVHRKIAFYLGRYGMNKNIIQSK